MEKIININGKDVTFKATGATPIHYRNQFGKDMMKEFAKEEPELTSFCELAYIMSGAFKDGISFEDWLEEFEPMDLIEKADEILSVYGLNTQEVEGKKGKNR